MIIVIILATIISIIGCSVAVKQDETSNWKTYKNDDYGIELKYQNESKFELRDNPNEFILHLRFIGLDYKLDIFVRKKLGFGPRPGDITEYRELTHSDLELKYNDEKKSVSEEMDIIKEREIMIDKTKGKRFVGFKELSAYFSGELPKPINVIAIFDFVSFRNGKRLAQFEFIRHSENQLNEEDEVYKNFLHNVRLY